MSIPDPVPWPGGSRAHAQGFTCAVQVVPV
jgi:hypothetical protein